ncbi:hypothetical protein SAMN05421788_11910 [Filimonas lacunae]|uniref:Uncharacterized protein n=1 Tax=Filimonas lacunae TaxID=477680 RepID=A0A1N7RI00_9BACT|nr:hypothetical protein [Filimonas lacunae]SIT34776.1 hypothetical protein SAMN05421788_11910 [Filimonas lacunae]
MGASISKHNGSKKNNTGKVNNDIKKMPDLNKDPLIVKKVERAIKNLTQHPPSYKNA